MPGHQANHSDFFFEHDPLSDLSAIKLSRLSQGLELIDLSMINPDLPPNRLLVDKLVESAMKLSNHRYSVVRGIQKLREAFATLYSEAFKVNVDPESEVAISLGGKDALLNLLLSQVKLGSVSGKALLGSPTYPAYLAGLRLAGLEFDTFRIVPDESQMLAEIEEAFQRERFSILILNFPNNPTGLGVTTDFYKRLAKVAPESLLIINDFVYGQMGYGGAPQPSLLSVRDLHPHLVEIYSLSKAYSVPGWRIGALIGSSAVLHLYTRMKVHVDYGAFLPIQIAAAAALGNSSTLVSQTASEYERRSRLLLNGISRLGFSASTPQAGCSVWASWPDFLSTRDSHILCRKLLELNGVMLLPGFVFGAEYSSYVRFALVANAEKINNVTKYLAQFIEQFKQGGYEHLQVQP